MKRYAFLAVFLLTVGHGFSAASQVEFVAKIKTIEAESDEVANLTMQLTSTFDMTVRVTEMTEIRGESDIELSAKDLKEGMLLQIEGIFTDKMILAKELQVFEGVAAFEIKGPIETIDTTAKTITILGLSVTYTDETSLKGAGSFADLKAGDIVKIEGRIEDSLIATDVIVSTAKVFRAPRISFEGIVTSVTDTELKVLIEGVDEVVVRVSEETDVHGDVTVGVGVRVIGTIGEDLVVDAAKVIVQKLLQVAPARLKLQPDQVRQVAVILHTLFEEDVEVEIESAKPEIAEALVDKIVIPGGKLTGLFEVKGKAVGETVIEVSLPASMGGTKAEVEVLVEDKGGKPGDDDGQGGDGKPALAWSPASLVLKPGQTRQAAVRLLADPATTLSVALSLKSGDADVVQFPATVSIAPGAKYAFVTFTAGEDPGKLTVLAKLPDTAGGDEATIAIEVRAKQQ
ncbi:MAG: DUF5666 domain-containing protein [Acidobacteriota bacterium]